MDMAAFDNRPQAHSSYNQIHHQYQQINVPSSNMYAPAHQPPTPVHQTPFRGGYGEVQQQRPAQVAPQIYTAVYSSVAVYEMEVNGVAVMRRRSDGWLNATQILKVAGVDKGKRTKILEKEILPGEHEKIQGGYGKYQGTWISYQRGREFCRQYGVEEMLRPLLDYDLAADGSAVSGAQMDTPTKEQALAANRKRFLNSSVDHRMNGHPSNSNNTFFQNISPTASNALAAMSKAARYDSSMPPRPGSSQHRMSTLQQQQQIHNQQQYTGQPVLMSDTGDSHPQQMYAPIGSFSRPEDGQEPPRKRMKSSQDYYSHMDPALGEVDILRQQEQMAQLQYAQVAEQGPFSQPPLPQNEKAGEDRRLVLLDLFADSSRTDFSSHPAIMQLSGEDLDTPLDGSANTALHWAATLARVNLMKLLISRGANIFRGNAAGQTALMAAVQVNNSLDHSCFPEILEILGPLIEIRDATGRTVLHHIAVSSGIKGRSISSRYYLESLLEFVVQKGGGQGTQHRPISLSRFMSEVVNVQDKSGNTALNLVARIGNRAIINQLDELGADFSIPNHTGIKPTDFGILPQKQGQHSQRVTSGSSSQTQTTGETQTGKPSSQIEQIKEEIFATTQSILTQTQAQYTTELAKHQSLLDHQNSTLRTIAQEHKIELDSYDRLSKIIRSRDDRSTQIDNLRRSVQETRTRLQQRGLDADAMQDVHHDAAISDLVIDFNQLPLDFNNGLNDQQHHYLLSVLPSTTVLRARLTAFSANNKQLEARTQSLKARSGDSELEHMYRRVVALCTHVPEDEVPERLEGLVLALESEGHAVMNGFPDEAGVVDQDMNDVDGRTAPDVGRVRDFLRKVEAV